MSISSAVVRRFAEIAALELRGADEHADEITAATDEHAGLRGS